MKSILIFGTLPPPVGGVTRSVENTVNALKTKNIIFNMFSTSTITSFKRFDIAHTHYTKRWKILTAAILGKVFAKKSILTYHGSDFYPDEKWIDRLLYILFDGTIVLNNKVLNRCKKLNSKKVVLFTPLFQEGIFAKNLDKSTYFEKEEDKKYILLYASGKAFFENKEVYGCSFVFSLLVDLPKSYKIVFADPLAGYTEDVKSIENDIIYFDKDVDFIQLLSSVDVYIRPTNFDGSSVSILEALAYGTPVLASDVVDRGSGVKTYKNNDVADFIDKLKDIINNQHKSNERHLTSIDDFEMFCNKLLGEI